MELVVAHKGKQSWRCRVRGLRGAFGADAAAASTRSRSPARSSRTCARWRARSATTGGSTTTTTSRSRRCTSARSTAARRSTSCRATASSTSSSATCRSTIPTRCSPKSRATPTRFVPEMHAVAADTGIDVRRAVDAAGLRHARRQRHRRARPALQRHARRATRSRSAPRRRCSTTPAIPDDPLRPRPHRAGAPARTSGSRSSSWRAARRSCAGSPTRSASRDAPPCTDAQSPSARVAPHRRSKSRFPTSRAGQRGNAGMPYVWRFASSAPGPHVVVQALTHGNEVCGAIALDCLLATARSAGARHAHVRVRQRRRVPARSTAPIRSRRAASTRTSTACGPPRCSTARARARDLARARELRPLYDRADSLLDLHSMTDPVPAARARRPAAQGSRAGARPRRAASTSSSTPATPRAAAARLRVLRRSGRPAHGAADRMRPALGARGARRRASSDAALPAPLRHARPRRCSTRISTPRRRRRSARSRSPTS